jgi:hypothetical protein
MLNLSHSDKQVLLVNSFSDFLSTPFHGNKNAICWQRELIGDFEEIVNKIDLDDNMTEIAMEELLELQLTQQGHLAREILLNDFKVLKEHGGSPVLNAIKYYERDDSFPFFPTDVYSYHVDRSPIPADTILCTYFGEPSDILANAQAQQKVLIPEIRNELRKLYDGIEEGFEAFLTEHFFDLHYQAKPNAQATSLGIGHLWRLAIDHPESQVPPCVHRAPVEKDGQRRLLMIC